MTRYTGYRCVVCDDRVPVGYSTNACCGGAVCLREERGLTKDRFQKTK